MSDILSGLSTFGMEQANPTTAMLAVGAGVLSYSWWSLRRPYKAPPGPAHIPLVGNNVFTGNRDINVFADLAKKYGRIYSIYLGNKYV